MSALGQKQTRAAQSRCPLSLTGHSEPIRCLSALLLLGGTFRFAQSFLDRWLAASGNFHMYEDLIAPWLMQYPTIWTALLIGLVPAMIANFKRRSVMRWYAYGFACSLVALPLVTLPTAHAFLLRSRSASPKSRQRERRTDALALLAESSVRSYPTWIADLRLNRQMELIVVATSTRRSDRATQSNWFARTPITTSMP